MYAKCPPAVTILFYSYIPLLFCCKGQLLSVAVYQHIVAVLYSASYELSRQLRLHISLQESLDRSCSICRIIAFICNEFLCLIGQSKRDISLLKAFFDVLHSELYNPSNLVFRER